MLEFLRGAIASVKVWAGIAALFACLGVLASYAGRWLDIDGRLVIAAGVVAVYIILSMTVGHMRRRLASDLKKLPTAEHEALRETSRDIRHAVSKKRQPSVQATLWVGLIGINGAVLPLLIGPLILYSLARDGNLDDTDFTETGAIPVFLSLLLAGFAAAWCWWSVGVTVWRRWPEKRGVDMDELQYLGENASLLWPEGHFFEKTELGNILQRWRRK